MKPLFFTKVQQQIDVIVQNPAHGYVFHGQDYLYKDAAADYVATVLTGGESTFHSPNIIEISSVDNGNKIKLDAIRELREQLGLTAYDSVHPRVVIIRGAHLLTHEAVSALLKTLEEPNPGIVFILVTTRLVALPATIQSRLQSVHFVTPTEGEITTWLKSAGNTAQETIADLIQLSGGRPRLAYELATDSSRRDSERNIREVAEQFLAGSITQRFAIAMTQASAGQSSSFIDSLMNQLTGRLNESGIAEVAAATLQAEKYLAANVSPRLVLEQLSLAVAHA